MCGQIPHLVKNSEQHLFIAKTPRGKIGRSIELRYNSRFNALRFLITGDHDLHDLTAFDIPIKVDHWYHVIAYNDGKKQVLRINGQQVESPMTTDTIQKWVGPWRVGTRGLNATFTNLRIGGD
ncbi:MAG: hypothetical protein JKX85_13470 [Phycisphaeraceae bacterium]|nr:hypothetical protein [Phycisphaeraceae bacterium]